MVQSVVGAKSVNQVVVMQLGMGKSAFPNLGAVRNAMKTLTVCHQSV